MKRMIALLLLIALLFALPCGASAGSLLQSLMSSPVSGWDESTNLHRIYHGIDFSFPSYFSREASQKKGSTSVEFRNPEKKTTASLTFALESEDMAEETFRALDSVLAVQAAKTHPTWVSREDVTFMIDGREGTDHIFDVAENGKSVGYIHYALFYIAEEEAVISAMLLVLDEDSSNRDYEGDFTLMLNNAHFTASEPVRAKETAAPTATPAPKEEASSFGGRLVEVTADGQKLMIHADFKKVMDDYEDFFDSYVSLIKSGNFLSPQYMEMMTRYSTMMAEIDDLEDREMTTDEALYYTYVMLRIERKLLSAY